MRNSDENVWGNSFLPIMILRSFHVITSHLVVPWVCSCVCFCSCTPYSNFNPLYDLVKLMKIFIFAFSLNLLSRIDDPKWEILQYLRFLAYEYSTLNTKIKFWTWVLRFLRMDSRVINCVHESLTKSTIFETSHENLVFCHETPLKITRVLRTWSMIHGIDHDPWTKSWT